MRTFVITALIFFSLAPLALAAGASGSWNTPPGGNVNTPPGGNTIPTVSTDPSGTNVPLLNPLGTSCNSTNTDCLGKFLINILDFVVRIGSIVVILMLVFVGYKFVAAQGNDSKIIEARSMLLWTVVGALILLGAQAIAIGIQATVQALGG